MLRESVEASRISFDLHAVTRGKETTLDGIPHAEVLIDFAEASVSMDEGRLVPARRRVLEALGPEGLVDVAGVASNFERMVRIADGTGIPLDAYTAEQTADLRAAMGIDRFGGDRG